MASLPFAAGPLRASAGRTDPRLTGAAMQRAARHTTSSTLPAGATPRQSGPAVGHELSSRAHELSSNGVELLPKAGQPQPPPRAGARRAPCAPGTPRDGPILSSSHSKTGARRRGRRERRHQLADVAERVPPESRRGVAGGWRPDTRHDAHPGHRRGGASDQSVIHMRRPTAGRGAAECRGALTAAAPSLRSPPAALLAGEGCGLLAQQPAQGRRRVQAA